MERSVDFQREQVKPFPPHPDLNWVFLGLKAILYNLNAFVKALGFRQP